MFISNFFKKLNNRHTKFIPKFSKTSKVILSLVFFTSLIFFTNQVLAQKTFLDLNEVNTFNDYKAKEAAIGTGNNQEAWINESILSNVVSFNQSIGGSFPEIIDGSNPYKSSYVPSGLIGFFSQATASLYEPPISGVEYIAQTVNSFLGKPTYAQSGVTNKLDGIQYLWKNLRNSVYSLFSIFFILTGIAIMLRIKISPQAVITVQSALPKIIISLIMVTFSYAIAGLLIDLSYLFQGIAISLFKNNDPSINLFKENPYTFSDLMQADFWTTYNLATKPVPGSALALIATAVGGVLGLLSFAATGWNPVTGAVVGVSAFAIILLGLNLIIFINIVKFFFGAIKCYIKIIIAIILAPIEIGVGAIPKMKMGFSTWIIKLVANLSVFPASIVFLILINIISELISDNRKTLWSPSIINIGWILGPAIGIGGIMMLSTFPTAIPEAIFKLKPSEFGKGIGVAFAPVTKMARGLGRPAVGSAGSWLTEKATATTNKDGTARKIGSGSKFMAGLGSIMTNTTRWTGGGGGKGK